MGIFKCLNYAERTTPCLALCMLLLAWSSACNANSRLPQEGAVAGPAVTKGIVLLIQFPDVRHNITRAQVSTRFNDHLNLYVREMSYGKVQLNVDLTSKWYTMPDPVSRYRISSRNLEVDKTRILKLIEDAVSAAEAEWRSSAIRLTWGTFPRRCSYPGGSEGRKENGSVPVRS